MMPFVTDSNALIIGATRGLGYALADTAIEHHHIRAIGLGRSASPGVLIRRGAHMIPFDLTRRDTWDRALEAVTTYRPDYVVWNAGIFDPKRRPFSAQPEDLIDAMIDTHLRGPVAFLRRVHALQKKLYHLIVVASTSWYRLRENESLYCGLKAFKQAFARNFHGELVRDLPGSKVLTVNPDQDVSKMMNPFAVAEIVWREALVQRNSFDEINIVRDPDGKPRLLRGMMTPESPT